MKLTKEEFKDIWIKRSGLSKVEFDEVFIVNSCDCKESGCPGWCIESKVHYDFYNRIVRSSVN